MNCEHCQLELEDFLYGELTERAAAEVRQHLATCTACVAERARLESENSLFAEFYEQTAIEPAAESWNAIRARIATEPVLAGQQEKAVWWRTMFGWLLVPSLARQVAFALMLVAVSVIATLWVMRRDDGNRLAEVKPTPTEMPQTIAPEPVPAPKNELANVRTGKPKPQLKGETLKIRQLSESEVLAQQLARTEREYQNTIKLLERAIAKRRDSFAPEAVKKYESSLALIDSSIVQSKRALTQQPDDLAARQFLLAAYAKKVELMQVIAMQ
ncbi:MAG: zf-HC2 domain-containing protein [Acidobacteriota bacterium]|nr:zf-HC2 domain-containing protein [Acidobacteriota bacterium]